LFYLGDAPPSPFDKKPTTYSAEYLQKMGNDVNQGLIQRSRGSDLHNREQKYAGHSDKRAVKDERGFDSFSHP
jgi:hypothetical protein